MDERGCFSQIEVRGVKIQKVLDSRLWALAKQLANKMKVSVLN